MHVGHVGAGGHKTRFWQAPNELWDPGHCTLPPLPSRDTALHVYWCRPTSDFVYKFLTTVDFSILFQSLMQCLDIFFAVSNSIVVHNVSHCIILLNCIAFDMHYSDCPVNPFASLCSVSSFEIFAQHNQQYPCTIRMSCPAHKYPLF